MNFLLFSKIFKKTIFSFLTSGAQGNPEGPGELNPPPGWPSGNYAWAPQDPRGSTPAIPKGIQGPQGRAGRAVDLVVCVRFPCLSIYFFSSNSSQGSSDPTIQDAAPSSRTQFTDHKRGQVNW